MSSSGYAAVSNAITDEMSSVAAACDIRCRLRFRGLFSVDAECEETRQIDGDCRGKSWENGSENWLSDSSNGEEVRGTVETAASSHETCKMLFNVASLR